MKFKNQFLLLVLASLWGPSFLLIKIAVQEFSPLMLTTLRIGLAALLINLFLFFRGDRLTSNLTFWKHVTIAGFFAHAVPFFLINWGEQYIDSGLAAILNGLTPISTVVLAHFTISSERLTTVKLAGIIIGFFGMVVISAPNIVNGFDSSLLGIIAVTGGAISYGVAIVYSRKHLSNSPSMHAPTAQLLVTTLYLVPLTLLIESPTVLTNITWEAWSSLAALSLFGTAIAFILYYKLLENTSASYLSLVTYIMPIYGVVLGIIILNEKLSTSTIWGMGLIFLGILIVNYKKRNRSILTASSIKTS